MASLGVNIDHIANVRQARQTIEPDPVRMAFLAELGGADGITVHLREDRRHIQDRDLMLLKETIHTRLNLEIGATPEMIEVALKTRPNIVTLVPERRKEVTTEGGLDVVKNKKSLEEKVTKLHSKGIPTSLFIDPEAMQIKASVDIGAKWVELHTGTYAIANKKDIPLELSKIKEAVAMSRNFGLHVNAGHGLTYQNVEAIASISEIEELNIGHTIISRALAVGLKEAVKEMKELINKPRHNFM